jgi:hypothetical protein
MKRVLDYDPVTKIVQHYHHDELTGDVGLETVQDVTAIIEYNKIIYNQFDERARWGSGPIKVASIPAIIHAKLLKLSNNGKDQKALNRWMDDPDNRVFKTRPGKLFRSSKALRTR